jgi:citrate lyase subunit beta / citryl-CoA lyase
MNNTTNSAHLPRRPPSLRRGWMFVAGMDTAAQVAAINGGADVVVADLEEFTAAADRPVARVRIAAMLSECRERGVVGAVRVNKLASDGRADLAGVMHARPDVVFLPHVETAEHIVALAREIATLEEAHDIPVGSTEIVPTIESAAGLLAISDILRASERVKACLLAAEDFAASLGAERGEDCVELLHARGRFLLECTAAGCVAIDCPFTFRAIPALEEDLRLARRLGFKSKCVVFPEHVQVLNNVLTPSEHDAHAARELCAAYERQRGNPNCDINRWIDAPRYNNARRLLERHAAFSDYSKFQPAPH